MGENAGKGVDIWKYGGVLDLNAYPISHELCSCPFWVEESPESLRIKALSHEPLPWPMQQLKGISFPA